MMTTIAPSTQVSTGSSHRGAPRSRGDAFAATLADVCGQDRSRRAADSGTSGTGSRASAPTSRGSTTGDGRRLPEDRVGGAVADGGTHAAAAAAPAAAHTAAPSATAVGTDGSGAMPGTGWSAGSATIADGGSSTSAGDPTRADLAAGHAAGDGTGEALTAGPGSPHPASADPGTGARAAGSGTSAMPADAGVAALAAGTGSSAHVGADAATTPAGPGSRTSAVGAHSAAHVTGEGSVVTGTNGTPRGAGSTAVEAPGTVPVADTGAAATAGSVPGDARSTLPAAGTAADPAADGAVTAAPAPLGTSSSAGTADPRVAGDPGSAGSPDAVPDAGAGAVRLAEHAGADRPEGVVRGVEASPPTARAETAARAEAASSSPAAPQPPALSSQLAASLARLRTAPDGQHVLNIHVTPDDLGPVRVTAHIGADGVRLELVGMTEGARDALRGALSELRRELAASGFAADLDLGAEHGPSQHRRPERSADPRAFEQATSSAAPAPAHHAAPPGGHGLDLLA